MRFIAQLPNAASAINPDLWIENLVEHINVYSTEGKGFDEVTFSSETDPTENPGYLITAANEVLKHTKIQKLVLETQGAFLEDLGKVETMTAGLWTDVRNVDWSSSATGLFHKIRWYRPRVRTEDNNVALGTDYNHTLIDVVNFASYAFKADPPGIYSPLDDRLYRRFELVVPLVDDVDTLIQQGKELDLVSEYLYHQLVVPVYSFGLKSFGCTENSRLQDYYPGMARNSLRELWQLATAVSESKSGMATIPYPSLVNHDLGHLTIEDPTDNLMVKSDGFLYKADQPRDMAQFTRNELKDLLGRPTIPTTAYKE